MVITNNLVLAGSSSPSSLSHQEKVRPQQSGPAWAAGVRGRHPTVELRQHPGISEMSPAYLMEPHCHPVRRMECSPLLRRGSGGRERTRLGSCTCGGPYPGWRPAAGEPDFQQPGGPNTQREAPLAGEAKRTQACPLLHPSCSLFLHLLVLGSCSLHLPQ